ncbi:MAG: hypothetical protein ACE5KZ_06230 [Candidatus Scalinduaceae bacterium]
MKKVKITWNWPVEEGHYLVGNFFSPVAVVVILTADYDKIPEETETLVRVGVEKGAAISGTLQTANLGIEKIVLNIVSNPNIRWIVLTGRKSAHKADSAIKALVCNGIDEHFRILETPAPTAILKNISREAIEQFRKQISLLDVSNSLDKKILEQVVCACYQEKPSTLNFRNNEYKLWDKGAFTEVPIIEKITDKLTKKSNP